MDARKKEKGLNLGVSLDGSALKLLEKVDASLEGGFAQLVGALEPHYQPADQITLYWIMLWSMPQEAPGHLGDRVEQQVRSVYPNAEGDITDNLAQNSFVASLVEGELRHCFCQVHPATFMEAQAAAVKGVAFTQAEHDKDGMIKTLAAAERRGHPKGQGGPNQATLDTDPRQVGDIGEFWQPYET